jgi:hypothetical protein
VFQALGRPHVLSTIHAFRAAALVLGIWSATPYGLSAICGVVLAVMALVSATMLIGVSHAIDLSIWRIAQVHVRPAAISAVIVGTGLSLKMRFLDAPVSVALVGTFIVLATFILLNVRSTYRSPAYASGAIRIKQRGPSIGAATSRLRLTRKESV